MNWATYCSVKTYKKTIYFPLIVGPGSVHKEMIFLPEPQITGSWKLCYREYSFTLNNKLSPLPDTAVGKATRCILNIGFLILLHVIHPSSFPSCTVWPWILVINPVSPVWHVSPKLKMHFAQWNECLCVKLCLLESQQQTQHWRNAGRSCCNTELGWNYEYAIKKSGFFCVTELGWKEAKKYLWQKQCISWSGNGNALPCYTYAICLPCNFWMFNRL